MNPISVRIAELMLLGRRILWVRAEAKRYAIIATDGEVEPERFDTGATTPEEFDQFWEQAVSYLPAKWFSAE